MVWLPSHGTGQYQELLCHSSQHCSLCSLNVFMHSKHVFSTTMLSEVVSGNAVVSKTRYGSCLHEVPSQVMDSDSNQRLMQIDKRSSIYLHGREWISNKTTLTVFWLFPSICRNFSDIPPYHLYVHQNLYHWWTFSFLFSVFCSHLSHATSPVEHRLHGDQESCLLILDYSIVPDT